MKDIKQKPNLGRKILIIGCAGSGKTTLAKRLTKLTGLPIIHLDNYYWNENWGKKSDEEWGEIVKDLSKQPKWIMDGNYTKTIPIRIQHATAIIYLDVPRWKCLLRVFIRRFRLFHNRKRNDLPTHCNERLNLEFYRWVWNYSKRSRNQALDLLSSSNKIIFHLKTNREVQHFIEKCMTTSILETER
jgi:adenylate kinase family enzyme